MWSISHFPSSKIIYNIAPLIFLMLWSFSFIIFHLKSQKKYKNKKFKKKSYKFVFYIKKTLVFLSFFLIYFNNFIEDLLGMIGVKWNHANFGIEELRFVGFFSWPLVGNCSWLPPGMKNFLVLEVCQEMALQYEVFYIYLL
jgi:hypothetical protein